uniref:Uncharacterized protein n=1 Tax=Meloidogyne incognita TaxID=6306 RepID=A0A914N8J2_MELIC
MTLQDQPIVEENRAFILGGDGRVSSKLRFGRPTLGGDSSSDPLWCCKVDVKNFSKSSGLLCEPLGTVNSNPLFVKSTNR